MDASKLFSLNWADAGKALLIVVLTTILGSLYTALDTAVLNHALPDLSGWHDWLMGGIMAGVTYLFKNLLTNSKNQLATPENSKP